jgi:hypothetical protein
MGIRFLKIAAVYLVIGSGLGLYMGIAEKFTLHPVHAHLNLLGWASLALAGLIYTQFPEAAKTRLARVHFWMHNVSLPVLMIALAMLVTGHEAFGPVVGISATVMAAGLAIFVANVLLNVKGSERAKIAQRPTATPALAK